MKKRKQHYEFKAIDCFTSEILCDKCEHGLLGKCTNENCNIYLIVDSNKDGKFELK